MFAWLRQRRRRALREQPFPSSWDGFMRRNVQQTHWLDESERQYLREWMAVFIAEKCFEGCGGLVVTDEIRVTIAAQAGIIVLGFQNEYFDALQSVIEKAYKLRNSRWRFGAHVLLLIVIINQVRSVRWAALVMSWLR